ncbi:MAG: acetylesterase [Bacilli bacterium]|jgi:S-formylglutathione hydrolase FrmB|nr:acetylesterase [Bacilli bacterium]
MAVAEVNFFSQNLLRFAKFTIVLPTDKTYINDEDKPKKAPAMKTLYLLHGILDNYFCWNYQTRIQRLADELDICVVMPDGDNKFYRDSEISGDYYGKLIGEELIEFTRNTFNLSNKREDTYIGGCSMGGYGALMLALEYPDTFSKVIALSGGFNLEMMMATNNESREFIYTKRQYETMFGVEDISELLGKNNLKTDYYALAQALKDSGKPLPQIYSECGTEDWLYEYNVTFKDKMIAMGYDVTWVTGPGEHDWDFWDKGIEHALKWLGLKPSDKWVSGGKLVMK